MAKRDINIEDDCEDFTIGEPNGNCESDGHYMCHGCKFYRADFLKGGQDYIDAFYSIPIFYITTLQ